MPLDKRTVPQPQSIRENLARNGSSSSRPGRLLSEFSHGRVNRHRSQDSLLRFSAEKRIFRTALAEATFTRELRNDRETTAIVIIGDVISAFCLTSKGATDTPSFSVYIRVYCSTFFYIICSSTARHWTRKKLV